LNIHLHSAPQNPKLSTYNLNPNSHLQSAIVFVAVYVGRDLDASLFADDLRLLYCFAVFLGSCNNHHKIHRHGMFGVRVQGLPGLGQGKLSAGTAFIAGVMCTKEEK